MRRSLFLIVIFIVSCLFSQNWYNNKKNLDDDIPAINSKTSAFWLQYSNNPSWPVPIPEERAVCFNINDFGVEYPVNLHGIGSYLYSEGAEFDFIIYAKDGSEILYEIQGLTSIQDYNEHYLTEPIVLNDDFYIALKPNSDGTPLQLLSDAVEISHSYIGSPGSWELFTDDFGDMHEIIMSVQLSSYTGTDNLAPTIRSVLGVNTYSDLNANIGLLLQDQSALASPMIGEYSFDDGLTWNSFDMSADKGTYLIAGTIPAQTDGTNGIVRFNLEDSLSNISISDVYSISWSDANPIFISDFEDDPFITQGWTLQSVGAGWKHRYVSSTVSKPHSGEYHMAHLDDSGTQDDWLITPVISLPDKNNILLSFWEVSKWVEFIGVHEISVTTDGGTTWTQISSTVPLENVYTQVFCPLDDYKGQEIQIGWHYLGDYNDQWYVDDVEIFINSGLTTITKMYANLTLLPDVAEVINEDMVITLGIYDKSYIETAVGHYTFDGGVTYTDVNMTKAKGEEVWEAVIPALDSAATGSIYFDITNLTGYTYTTGN
ncbi:MAG: hypothetical protein GQ534_03825, partial [Candidatus Delongbacteria bacterium]|nr:hypothetical protein [Candidatus Delongbacteria bacterium]